MKRSASKEDGSISPPTVKRKVESTTNSKAVATFFTPASQRSPEQVTWRIINHSLIVGIFNASTEGRVKPTVPKKIAAFDFDDTLIKPNLGSKWSRSATSWKWWDTSVPGKLKDLHSKGYLIVVISNQGNISLKENPKALPKDTLSLANFKNQVTSVIRQLDFPVSVYAATGQDLYRKPRVGMWLEVLEDHDLIVEDAVDRTNSFLVGDAAGRDRTERRRKDHACSDRDLAANIGIAFHTPEEYFLNEQPEPFERDFDPKAFLRLHEDALFTSQQEVFQKRNIQEVLMSCGCPASGKSSFFWTVLQPLGYERVNQDLLKTRDRCLNKARDCLRAGSSVAIDNTNADIETRAYWVRLAKEFSVPIRCVHFTTPPRICEHNDTVRALSKGGTNPEDRTLLPGIAFRSFAQRFTEPTVKEGFQDITKIDFLFRGTTEQRNVWGRYWVSKFST